MKAISRFENLGRELLLKINENRLRLGRNNLITNASIYVLGTMLQRALSFLLIPLYTRYLTPSDYGIVGLAVAVSGILSMVIGLGIYGAITRYYYEYHDTPDRLHSYITTNFLFLAVFSIGVSFLLDQTGGLVWPLITSGQVEFVPYVRLMIWSACLNVLVHVPIVLYQAARRPVAFVLAN
jgi:O-antigen/teichoic acid export membrane protein